MSTEVGSRNDFALLMLGGLITIAAIATTSLYRYPVYHTLVEIFSMVIAGTVFITVWSTRRVVEHDYLLFIGIAFLFFVILNVPHTLGYQGIQLFPGFDANLPTQLYIIQRYMLSVSLLIAPSFLMRRLPIGPTFAAFALFTALALLSTMVWRNFPAAFISGHGLTPFKIYSEYVISTIMLIGLARLWAKRRFFDQQVLLTLAGALVALTFSEIMFTLYSTPFGLPNFLGHVSQIVAFYLVYVAVIRTALERPHELLYRGLAESEHRNRSVAETLQSALLGIDEVFPRVELAHEYRAASDVSRIGGDFYDVFEVDEGRLGVLLGDVSGKGLSAAATTATVKSTIRALAHVNADPAFVLEKANRVMYGQLDDDQFVTIGYGVLDLSTGHILYGSAGHTDPIVCGNRCHFATVPANLPLGTFPATVFLSVDLHLNAGDLLVLYSDGLTDARHDSQLFGEAGIMQGLEELKSLPCDAMVKALVERADEFSKGRLPDDTAVLVVRYLPTGKDDCARDLAGGIDA